jgi:hypothetical protein
VARPLTINEQLAGMKSIWPRLRPRNVNRAQQAARWVGRVRPQYEWHELDLRYAWGAMPEVRVTDPPLVRLPGNEEGQLPHVYPPLDDPTLCLFDPRAHEWDTSMLLAKTIVPWALDWLACYEHWLMTGTWSGGGRHVDGRQASPTTD